MLVPLIWLAGLTAFQAQVPALPPPAARTLNGRVVDSVTGEPIRKASVALLPNTDAGPRLARFLNGQALPTALNSFPKLSSTFLTDAAGNFQARVTPGTYFASADRSGFVESEDSAATITVADGETTPTLTLKLHKQGVITGRVFNEDGEPMARAMVQPLRWMVAGGPNGHRTLMPQGDSTTSTNDLGEYRILGLRPGKYLLSAQSSYRGHNDLAAREAYTTLYFPNVAELAAAQPIEVPPGGIRQGVDFRLTKTSVVRLSGRVSPMPSPNAERRSVNTMVTLSPRSAVSPMARIDRQRSAQVNPQGEFLLTQVPSGSYTLTANTLGPNQDRRTARIIVEVGDRDLNGIALALEPPLTLNGRFVADDPTAPLASLTAHLQAESSAQSVAAYGRADAQGRFVINNLERDAFHARFNGLPAGHYVKSVQLGSLDAKSTLDLSAGVPGELVVTLEKGTAELTGRLIHPSQNPAPRLQVLLINAQMEVRAARADAQGQYSFKEITPGDYRLIATATSDFSDPDTLTRLANQAQKITLPRSARETRQLELR